MTPAAVKEGKGVATFQLHIAFVIVPNVTLISIVFTADLGLPVKAYFNFAIVLINYCRIRCFLYVFIVGS